MTWIDVGFNGEEGWRKVRMHVPRVPARGEKFEFWNPDGGAAEIDAELDGNAFYVAEVCWVAHSAEGGPIAEPIVFLVPKSQWTD